MCKRLIIVGAGIYSAVVYDIACGLGVYDDIVFVDDSADRTPLGNKVSGKICDIATLFDDCCDVVIAIGNPSVREKLIEEIKREEKCNLISLVSSKAVVSSSAVICDGCVIEPMAVVHPCCVLGEGVIVSAGAVINHGARCGRCSHIDCNATVEGFAEVPAGFKLSSGRVFTRNIL